MTTVFVAGSHTDVGKTHVACALLRAARARGMTVDAFKPVVSGFDPAEPDATDPGRLLAALGRDGSPEAFDAIAPIRFGAPLAPPLAARAEGVALRLDALLGQAEAWRLRSAADLRIVEGAGGVMSPMAEDALCLDLMTSLWVPVVLVAGVYLGAMSHGLSALDVVRSRGLRVVALVVSEGRGRAGPRDLDDTVEMMRRFGGDVPVHAANSGPAVGWADAILDDLRRA